MKTSEMKIPALDRIAKTPSDFGWTFEIRPMDGVVVPNYIIRDIYQIANQFDWDSDGSLLDELNWSLKYCNEFTSTIVHSPKFTTDIDQREFIFEFQLNCYDKNFYITFNFKK